MADKSRHYKASDIAKMSSPQVWALPMGGLFVTFDNGEELKCKTTAIIISWYYWKMNVANSAPILPTHFLGNGNYKANAHLKLASTVLWDSYYNGKSQSLKMFWKLSEIVYSITTNEQYNHIITYTDADHATVDLSDVMDILTHEIVEEILGRYEAGTIDEVQAHKEIFDFIESGHEDLKHNQIAHMVLCELSDRRQMSQIIGPRANIADISGDVFPHAIKPGYGEGLRSLYDMGIESRTSSIALYAQGANLEDSEFTNRQGQLLTSVLRTVDYKPCKGFKTTPWAVKEEDSLLLAGINYMDGKKVTRIHSGNFNDLVGQTIQLRMIHNCGNGKPDSPCVDCVGQNAISLPPGANLGHHMIVETLGKLSQLMLSTKHVIANAIISYLLISGDDVPFIKRGPGDNKDKIYIKRAKTKGWKLRLPRDGVMQLPMIQNVDLDKLAIERVSSLMNMTFVKYNNNGDLTDAHDVSLRLAGKGSPLSTDALEYLKNNGWENHPDFIEIDLTDWDINKPIARTLPRGQDIKQTLDNFNSFMLFHKASGHSAKITDFTSVEAAIPFLAGILQATLQVNLITVQVFVRCLMAEIDSYKIPTHEKDFVFVGAVNAIKNRNLGNALAFQGQPELIINPATYLGKTETTLMPTPLDMLWA